MGLMAYQRRVKFLLLGEHSVQSVRNSLNYLYFFGKYPICCFMYQLYLLTLRLWRQMKKYRNSQAGVAAKLAFSQWEQKAINCERRQTMHIYSLITCNLQRGGKQLEKPKSRPCTRKCFRMQGVFHSSTRFFTLYHEFVSVSESTIVWSYSIQNKELYCLQ